MHATDPESVLGDLASGDQQVSELARSRDPFVLVATRGGESSATIAIVTVGATGWGLLCGRVNLTERQRGR